MASCARRILSFGSNINGNSYISPAWFAKHGKQLPGFIAMCPSKPFSSQPESQPVVKNVPELPKVSLSPLPTSIAEDSLRHEDYFGVRKLFTVRDLFDARVHLGHKVGSMDKRMAPFMFGERLGQLIFDLDQTAYHLRAALNMVAHVTFRQGMVLFVHRNNPANSHMVERVARDCGEFVHTRAWYSGLLTNSSAYFGTVTRLPDLLVLLSARDTVLEQHPAVVAAAKMLIPTVGIVDSDCDPCLITYPVPGNDDTPCAIELYLRLFSRAVMLGKSRRKEMQDAGLIPLPVVPTLLSTADA